MYVDQYYNDGIKMISTWSVWWGVNKLLYYELIAATKLKEEV